MSDRNGPGHRVVARKQQGERPALGVDLVHGPQAPGHGLLLAAALALEPLHLAAQGSHVALGLLDARVQPRDVALLVGQPLLDPVQLGQDRGLLLARLGRLAPLLLELLFRLAQLPLLALERVLRLVLLAGVLPGRLGDGARRSQRGHEGEDGEAGEGPRAHTSGRPRARKPPMPPSSVPASISEITLWGRRNVSRGTPSVSLMSGSIRGPISA